MKGNNNEPLLVNDIDIMDEDMEEQDERVQEHEFEVYGANADAEKEMQLEPDCSKLFQETNIRGNINVFN